MTHLSRRGLLLAAAATPALVACSKAAATVADPGDYRSARVTFRTRLLRKTPSPQRGAMPAAPEDVEVVEIPSGPLTLKAWVGKPAKMAETMPVVIFLHGGFAFGADDYQMAEPYRQAGFVVVTPILRGENGQAGNFSMFYDEVDDVLATADYVRSQPWVDASRVFLSGHSVGGTHAMLAGMATEQFRAVTSFSGSPDQALWTSHPPWSGLVPFDTTDPREFEMRSPLSYAASFRSPARLFYGAEEDFFALTTPALAEAARKAGLDVESRTFPGDHFGAVPAELEASIAFFNQQT